jgi:hypothetical protein
MATSILNVKKLKFIYKKDRVRAMVFNVTFKFEYRKKKRVRDMVFNAEFKFEFRSKKRQG